MMPSAPTHQPSDARLWPALGQHGPRLLQVNKSPGIAPPTLSSSARCARQHVTHTHPATQSDWAAPGSNLVQPDARGQIPIEPAAPTVPTPPRFRALALFRRRPPEHGKGSPLPASENLHISGRSDGPGAPSSSADLSPAPPLVTRTEYRSRGIWKRRR